MSDYFLGEIRMFSFAFAPVDWALANGALLPVNQNAALFSLLQNQFGGTYPTDFGLPDLRGRAPVGWDGSVSTEYSMGAKVGVETVTLTSAQMPPHTHHLKATTAVGELGPPEGRFLAKINVDDLSPPNQRYLYVNATPTVALNPQSIGTTGGGQPHTNMQPFAVANFCICISGIYPPRP